MSAFITGLIFFTVYFIITLRVLNRRRSIGTLIIDHTDPDGPYMFLELKNNIKVLEKNTYVTLKVKNKKS